MFQLRTSLLPIAAFLLLCGPSRAHAQGVPAGPPAVADRNSPEEPLTLQPGDLIRIAIWREEELSGEFSVGGDGVVVLPLLGQKQVANVPLTELRDILLREYQRELRNPAIEITPLRRINVLGEVNKPGLYEVDPTITLSSAVALAGGATPTGDLGKIRVVRGDRVIRERVGAQASLSSADVRSGDQIFVEPKNWFARNSTFLVSAALAVPGVIATVLALTR